MKNDALRPVRSTPEAVWLARREPAKRSLAGKAAAVVAAVPRPVQRAVAASFLVYVLCGIIGQPSLAIFGLLILAVTSCAAAAMAALKLKREEAGSPELASMIETTGLAGGHQVSLAIYVDGTGTGFDEGIVIFQDGMLRYFGLHTSFRLSTGLVYTPGNRFKNGPFEWDKKAGPPLGDHEKGIAFGFMLREPKNVEIVMLSTEGGERERQFERTLYKWLLAPPAQDDNSILPPLETQPEMRKRRRKTPRR